MMKIKPRHQKTKFAIRDTQSGAVLLMFLAILMVTLTVTLISKTSIQSIQNEKRIATVNTLEDAKKLLLGYALTQSPLGSLPCPAITPAGVSSTNAGGCTQKLGYFPFQTLGSTALYDAYGSLLWYAVDDDLAQNSSTLKNSDMSLPITLEGTPVVAVLIAPGRPLNNLPRNGFNASAYLEGINDDGNANTYVQGTTDNENDIAKGISPIEFWSMVESRVLSILADRLQQYKSTCGEFPWAADFGNASSNSVDALQSGAVPFDSASPVDWDVLGDCSQGISLPASIAAAWEGRLYWQFCLVAEGNCLSTQGDFTQSVAAILVSPGGVLTGQTRPSTLMTDHFEEFNATADTQFTHKRFGGLDNTFNDSLHVVAP